MTRTLASRPAIRATGPPRPDAVPAAPARSNSRPPPHVLLCRPDGIIEQMTAEVRTLLGAPQPGPLCFYSLVHGKNLYRVLRDVAEMVCDGKPEAAWLLRLRTADGCWRWFEVLVDNALADGEAELRLSLREV